MGKMEGQEGGEAQGVADQKRSLKTIEKNTNDT
jgi:hypothetical protein